MPPRPTLYSGRAAVVIGAVLVGGDPRAALVSTWRLDDAAAPAACDVRSTYEGVYEGGLAVNQAGRIGTLSAILTVNSGALDDYNSFQMNRLYQARDTSSAQEVTSNAGTLLWEKFTGASGTAGSVSIGGERYNAWFVGTSGMSALVPAPATGLCAGLAGMGAPAFGLKRLPRCGAAA